MVVPFDQMARGWRLSADSGNGWAVEASECARAASGVFWVAPASSGGVGSAGGWSMPQRSPPQHTSFPRPSRAQTWSKPTATLANVPAGMPWPATSELPQHSTAPAVATAQVL